MGGNYRAGWSQYLTDVPPQLLEMEDSIQVQEGNFNIAGSCSKIITVHYKECSPASIPPFSILFLHAESHTSQNWVNIKALQMCAAAGFRAVAIDLPGRIGRTTHVAIKPEPIPFMAKIIDQLNLGAPVIVSPSHSGIYSLPYIMQDPPTAYIRSRGFMPIAPIGTAGYWDSQYKQCKIPTAVLYGVDDKTRRKDAVSCLRNIPDSEELVFEWARHGLYLEKPALFKRVLYNFLMALL